MNLSGLNKTKLMEIYNIDDEWDRIKDSPNITKDEFVGIHSDWKRPTLMDDSLDDIVEGTKVEYYIRSVWFDNMQYFVLLRYFLNTDSSRDSRENSRSLVWYRGSDGLVHSCDDRPSVLWGYGTCHWHKDGELHREDGPSCIFTSSLPGQERLLFEWHHKGRYYFPFRHIACLDHFENIDGILK
jgi:hypothetical protein